MTVDEYAAFEQATTNDQILQKDGFWWRRVRKGFYRPLAPFLPKFSPSSKPFGSVAQYGLCGSMQANSHMNLIVFDNKTQYMPEQLPRSMRRHLKKAMANHLNVEQIKDPITCMDEIFEVYQSFVQRTGYVYDRKRNDPRYFRQWIESFIKFPKVNIHGVFHEEQLLSFQISLLVEDVLVLKSIVNSEKGIQMNAPDIQLHHDRTVVREQKEIRMIYDGYFSRREGLNRYKLVRGARVWCLPSRLEAPVPLLKMVKVLKPSQYQHLMGFSQHKLPFDFNG